MGVEGEQHIVNVASEGEPEEWAGSMCWDHAGAGGALLLYIVQEADLLAMPGSSG